MCNAGPSPGWWIDRSYMEQDYKRPIICGLDMNAHSMGFLGQKFDPYFRIR